jgi:hypothetical protein
VLAWRVLLVAGDLAYDDVVDATSGALLVRHGLVEHAVSGLVFPAWPGAPAGGVQLGEDFTPWLSSATALSGPNAHVWADVDADGTPDPGEEQPPNPSGDYDDPYTTIASPTSGSTCVAPGCSWDSVVPNSWRVNVKQDAAQVFSFVNRFHDWLEAPPFGFTPALGNFEGDDPVNALTDFGADTAGGLPNPQYRNNANMSTPPDGTSPTMRMYLFLGGSRFHDANGGDDPTVVLHEYTHGLSNRLVVDGQGVSTLQGAQGGAMGEAWSDWYANDYLVAHGWATDDPATPGSLPDGPVTGAFLSEPPDCPVATAAAACPGTPAAGSGGYTYGDFGNVRGRGPEVHDDGEIWDQTLWDLRRALIAAHGGADGADRARLLVTRAMQLAPARPSFLDMRNAILQADTTFQSGADRTLIWSVFAQRGMGYFASTNGTDDVHPIEDFSVPPAQTGTISGRVVDSDGGSVAGARVTVGASSYVAGLSAVADATGRFTLTVPAGTYPRVALAIGSGLDPVALHDVVVPAGGSVDVALTSRRDWASSAAGATATAVSGSDVTAQGYGPAKLIDQTPAGWVVELDGRDAIEQITLPAAVDIATLTLDPSPDRVLVPTVGTGAGLGDYRIETSIGDGIWRVAASGTFTVADQGAARTIALDAVASRAVRAVRLTALSNAAHEAPSADTVASATELAVYGSPAAAPIAGGGTPPAAAPEPAPGPEPAPSPAPAPAPAAPAARAPSAPALLSAGRAPSLAAVARRGLPLRLRCPSRCRARVEVRFAGHRAALVTRSLRAGTTRIHVRLPRAVVRGLRTARQRPVVTVRVTIRTADGARTLQRRVRLRR